MAQTYQSLTLTQTDNVLTLSLTGPGKGNAMGPEFWDELPTAIDEINAMADVRAVVLRGSGDHFSYGLDIHTMMPRLSAMITGNVQNDERQKVLSQIRTLQTGFQKLHESSKPIIAAIHGWCIGGGLSLISAADIRLCAQDAKFSLREAKLGITPDLGGLQHLPHIIGQGYTRELALTAKDFDAPFAEKIGLVNHVFATPDELFASADEMARQIAALPAGAVQGAKAVLNNNLNKSVEDGLQYVADWNSNQMQSDDFSEAINATVERRQAEFNRKSERGY